MNELSEVDPEATRKAVILKRIHYEVVFRKNSRKSRIQ
jgi:hypothetical protein